MLLIVYLQTKRWISLDFCGKGEVEEHWSVKISNCSRKAGEPMCVQSSVHGNCEIKRTFFDNVMNKGWIILTFC